MRWNWKGIWEGSADKESRVVSWQIADCLMQESTVNCVNCCKPNKSRMWQCSGWWWLWQELFWWNDGLMKAWLELSSRQGQNWRQLFLTVLLRRPGLRGNRERDDGWRRVCKQDVFFFFLKMGEWNSCILLLGGGEKGRRVRLVMRETGKLVEWCTSVSEHGCLR